MLKNTLCLCLVLSSQLSFAQQTGSLEETTNEPETLFVRGSRIIFRDDFFSQQRLPQGTLRQPYMSPLS